MRRFRSGTHNRLADARLLIQHSPSSAAESKLGSEMLDFRGRKGLRQSISNHVGGRAIDEPKLALFNNPTDKVKTDIDMFGSRVILVVLRERNC
jgi:hypothetical protein